MSNIEKKLETLVSSALDLMRVDANKQAIDLLEEAIEINPNYSLAHLLMGMIYQEVDDLQAAEKAYLQAHNLDPQDTYINKTFGIFLFSQKRFSEAIDYLMAVFDEDPTDVEVAKWLYLLLSVYTERENETQDILMSAWENTKDSDIGIYLSKIYNSQNEYQKSIDVLTEILKTKRTSEVLKALSSAYFFTKNFEKSLEFIDEAIEVNPQDDDAWRQKAMLFQLKNELGPALDAAEKAYTINPDNLLNLYGKSTITFLNGNHKEFLEISNTIIDKINNVKFENADNIFNKILLDLYEYRFISYVQLDEPAKALVDSAFGETSISDESKLLPIAQKYLESKYQPEELLKIIESITDPFTHRKLLPWHFKILHIQNRIDDAWDLIYPHFQYDPENEVERAWAAYLMINLVEIGKNFYFEDHLPNIAIPIMKQLIKLQPDLDLVENDLAYILIGEGKYNEAQEILIKLTVSSSDNFYNNVAVCHLAYLYNITGKYQEAYDLLSTLISKDLEDKYYFFRISCFYDKKMLSNHNLQGYILNISDAAYACAISAAIALGKMNEAKYLIKEFEKTNHEKRLYLEVKGCYELECGNLEATKQAWNALLSGPKGIVALVEEHQSLPEEKYTTSKYLYLISEKDMQRVKKWLVDLEK